MIRKAQIEDAKSIAELYITSAKTAYCEFVTSRHLNKLSLEEKIQEFTEKIQSEIVYTYVNEENGVINGFIVFSKNIECYRLLQIHVNPQMRKKGIGKSLILFLESIIANSDINKLLLWAIKNNKEAIAFYEKMGFRHDKTERFFDKFEVQQIGFSKIINNINIA